MQQSDPVESKALNAIRMGGEWFLAQQNEKFLHYTYDANADRWPAERQYAREMAAFWAITELAGFLGDQRYLQLAQRGIDHFEKTFRLDQRHGFLTVAPEPDEIKLSYNAFLILGLLQITHARKRAYLVGLAKGIMHQQERKGRFRTFFYSERATGVEYYPGQAMLALMALYEQTEDERLLEPVARALPYYQGYWSRHPSAAFVPWQTRAYCKYHKARPSSEVAEFVFAINDFIVANMPASKEDSDADYTPGIATGVYVEGVNEAYRLARELGDEERLARYGDYIRKGCATIMDLQCPMPGQKAEDFAKPALGGFFSNVDDPMMRVDHNQHGVFALMAAYELGLID